jgi:hypothetical protein
MCCRFSRLDLTPFHRSVTAVPLSSSRLKCRLPPSLLSDPTWANEGIAFDYSISLSVNCEDYTDTGLTVRKLIIPSLLSASPVFGSSEGGTVVLVRGYGVGQGTARCLFGDLIVYANVLNFNMVACRSPRFMSTSMIKSNLTEKALVVPLKVSIDGGGTYFNIIQRTFSYILDPVITSISPSIAVERNPFYIKFYGSNFNQISHASDSQAVVISSATCRLGAQTSGLLVMSDSEAVCLVKVPEVGVFSVGMSLNGQQFVFADNALIRVQPLFSVDKAINKNEYVLFTGSKIGRDARIVVPLLTGGDGVEGMNPMHGGYGSGGRELLQGQTVICVTTTSGKDEGLAKIVYPAVWQNVSALSELNSVLCMLNNIPSTAGSYDLDIRLLSTGQSLIPNRLPLEILPPPTVTSSTLSLTASEFNSSITLISDQSFIGYKYYYCVYTSADMHSKPLRPLFANESMLICPFHRDMLPLYESTIASYVLIGLTLSLSLDDLVNMAGFSLLLPMTIISVDPLTVYEGSRSRLTLTSDYIHYTDLSCRIGDNSYPITVVSRYSMYCDVTLELPGTYVLYVTTDGKEYIEAASVSTILSPVIDTR